MSNDSSPSMPWFSGDSYNRVLAATPPEDTPPDFFYSPARTFVLRVNRPPSRPVTPRPVTPRPVTPALDDSLQDGQRPPWMFNRFSPQPWPASPTPPWFRQRHPFGYSDMTQDSGFFTEQQSHSTLSQVGRPATPSPPTTPGVYALNMIENMEFSPSPLRQSQMDEWLRSLSPTYSPDMFPPSTPGAYALNVVGGVVFSPSSRRQSQIDEWLRSLTPISPSMLNIERLQVLPEFDLLIYGRLLNTTQPGQNVTDWTDDGYNDILGLHVLAVVEEEWYEDGADEVLNRHMDLYEDDVCNDHMDAYEGKSCKN